jgi:chemotaxis protein methyltransferase CheR
MVMEAREFVFSTSDFNRVRAMLYDAAGIKLADSKDSMVYSRLARRLRALKITRFTDYLHYLETHTDELEHFINGLTTNLTSFFRENHHFEMLSRYLKSAHGQQRIWCTASSTGEEVYSIAMCAAEAYKTLTPPVEIIATDIDSNVLTSAQQGVYQKDRVANLAETRLKRFFHKGKGVNEGKVRIVPELRHLVTFQKLNLIEPQWPAIKGPLDIIFCRNVMIYFDKPTQAKVLTRLVTMLKDDGLYFAGHSESFAGTTKVLKPVGKTAYRKIHTSRIPQE